MKRSWWSFVPSYGALFSLILIGLILLSALLYYRAVKVQRYLEPALAIAQPRNEFSKNVNQLFHKEFGTESIKGLSFRSGSILVEKSLFFSSSGKLKDTSHDMLRKFARVFLSIMDDNHIRADISLILIGSRFHSEGNREKDSVKRMREQRMVGLIQDALFEAQPDLGKQYETYFVAAVQPGPALKEGEELLEFRIIPSELLHVEVLQKLVKYAF